MAFKLLDFECQECSEVQEQLVENGEDQADYPCTKCGAPPEKLKMKLATSTHGSHVSWSKWKV
jgi:uncharacterized Zn finger protein